MPFEWAESYVISNFRFDRRSWSKIYDPVALLSVISKIMQSLVDDVSLKFFENSRLHDTQPWFQEQQSCQTNLMETMDCYRAAEDGGVQ